MGAGDDGDDTLRGFLEALAARTPAPGAGAAAAVTLSIAAGLVAMTAAYADGVSDELPDGLADRARRMQSRALELADEDATAYTAVLRARSSRDDQALRKAWQDAVAVPVEIAECGARIAADAAWTAEHGRTGLRGDAVTGVVLAEAAVRSAVVLVELNVAAAGAGEEDLARARVLADAAAASVRRVMAENER